MVSSRTAKFRTATAMMILAAASGVMAADGQSVRSSVGTTGGQTPPLKLGQPRWLPLTARQITALFSEHTLIVNENYQPFPRTKVETFWIGGCPPREEFSLKRSWTRYECQRVPRVYKGAWTTERFRGGERLCVEAPDFPKLCRFVWQDASQEEVIMAADWTRAGQSQDDPHTFNPYRLVPSKG